MRLTPKLFRHLAIYSLFSIQPIFAAPASLVGTFGTNGVSTQALSTADDRARAMVVQADGKIIVASICELSSAYRVCLMRLSANGALDTSFAQQGVAATTITTTYSHYTAHMALADDGKIIIATACTVPNDPIGEFSRFCVARFTSNGVPDTSFGVAGVVTTPMSGGTQPIDEPVGVFSRTRGAIGVIVVTGNCQSADDPINTATRLCSVRYLAQNGALDPAYGTGGIAFHTNASWTATDLFSYAAVMASNGSLRIAATCTVGGVRIGCVVAVTQNGALVLGFGVLGVRETILGSLLTRLTAITQQRDDKLIVGGRCRHTAETVDSFCLTRIAVANGDVDTTFSPTFAPNGIVRTRIPPYNFETNLQSLIIDGDGAIVAAGACVEDALPNAMCVARYRPEGYLDTSFTATGVLTQALTQISGVQAAAIHPNGRILLAGDCRAASAISSNTCVAALEGGPQTFSRCSLDIDGDGIVSATDTVIWSRVMFDFDVARSLHGIVFNTAATRRNEFDIQNFLATHCGIELHRPVR